MLGRDIWLDNFVKVFGKIVLSCANHWYNGPERTVFLVMLCQSIQSTRLATRWIQIVVVNRVSVRLHIGTKIVLGWSLGSKNWGGYGGGLIPASQKTPRSISQSRETPRPNSQSQKRTSQSQSRKSEVSKSRSRKMYLSYEGRKQNQPIPNHPNFLFTIPN